MAAERTTRLRVYTWESDGDEFTRAQMTTSHQALEDRVGQFFAGSTSPVISLENPAARLERSLWLDTDDNVLYFFTTDNQWRALNAFAAPTTTLTPSDSNAAGSATTYARSDHSHAMLAFGTVGDVQTVGTAAAAGTLPKYARADHVHVLNDGAVTTAAKLADGVVTTAKIAAGNVTTDRLAAGAVTKTRLAADQQMATGMILPYAGAITTGTATADPAGSGVPAGWLLCNGGLHSTTQYADLFALIGYSYGGSGASFAVPNLTNRVAQGAGTTPLAGAAGGTVTLSEANLPAHSHAAGTLTISGAGTHTHTVAQQTLSGGGHDHNITSTPMFGSHDHGYGGRQIFYRDNTSPLFLTVVGDVGPVGANLRFSASDPFDTNVILQDIAPNTGTHNHTVPTQVVSGGDHSHTVTGATANTGSGTAFTVSPAHVGLHHLIKT